MIKSFTRAPAKEKKPTKPKKQWGKLRSQSRVDDNNPIRRLQCFDEVYSRICEGWPVTEVARFVHEIKKELTDMTRESLYQSLLAFKATIPPAELVRGTMPSKHVVAAEVVAEGLDELAELEKLYRLQMERIQVDVKNEQNIKKLLPTTGQEVRIAKEILTSYAGLKMDLGLSQRHLGQVDVNAKLLADVAVRYSKPEVQTVLNDAQSRKKVLGLAEKLLSVGGMRLFDEQEATEALASESQTASGSSSTTDVIDVVGEVAE